MDSRFYRKSHAILEVRVPKDKRLLAPDLYRKRIGEHKTSKGIRGSVEYTGKAIPPKYIRLIEKYDSSIIWPIRRTFSKQKFLKKFGKDPVAQQAARNAPEDFDFQRVLMFDKKGRRMYYLVTSKGSGGHI